MKPLNQKVWTHPPLKANYIFWLEPLKLLSVSGDSSAKVTEMKVKSETGLWIKSVFPYLIMNLVLVLLALYLLENYESILEAWEMGKILSASSKTEL